MRLRTPWAIMVVLVCTPGICIADPVEGQIARLKDPAQRESAARELGALGDARAVPHLIGLLEDRGYWVRAAALDGLVPFKDTCGLSPFLRGLRDSHPRVRQTAARHLGELRDKGALEPLIAVLKDKYPEVRGQAALALGDLGDSRASPSLVAMLKDSDHNVRLETLDALVNFKQTCGLTPFTRALKDSKPFVRSHAAWILGDLRDRRAVPALIPLLKDRDANVRSVAALKLGELGDRRAGGALFSSLRDASREVRLSAAMALGRLRDRRALKALTNLLGDPDPSTRHSAADALGELGDRRGLQPLVHLAHQWHLLSERWEVWLSRRSIARALVKLGWQPGTDAEKVDMWAALEQGDRIRDNWATARPILLAWLQSDEQALVEHAANISIMAGMEEAIPNLVAALKRKGNGRMAARYLHCQQGDLEDAASEWLAARGQPVNRYRYEKYVGPAWGAWLEAGLFDR